MVMIQMGREACRDMSHAWGAHRDAAKEWGSTEECYKCLWEHRGATKG
jgi:hypothetical protein